MSRYKSGTMIKGVKISTGVRLASMLLDHFFMVIIGMGFCIPMMVNTFSGAFTISHEQADEFRMEGPLFYFALFGFALYFCKDCVNGRSLAKRITKLQVIDNTTGEVASPLKCFVRNILCVIWPVEVLVTLSNPERRIGDIVAGTRIVHYKPTLLEQPEIRIKKIIVPVLLAYLFFILIAMPFQRKVSADKINFSESSYNEVESKEVEKLYATDSISKLLTASVKLYDSAANNKKYISLIFLLKDNYFNYPGKIAEIEQRTLEILYAVYPYNTISGHGQYIYQEDHFMQNYTNEIGIKVMAFQEN